MRGTRVVRAGFVILVIGFLGGCASAGRTNLATGAVLAAMPAVNAAEETRLSAESDTNTTC